MDAFSMEYGYEGYGEYYEYSGLCFDVLTAVGAKAVAFEVDIKHGGGRPPARFRDVGLPTLFGSRAEGKQHRDEKAGPAPMVARAQAKAMRHNGLVATRLQQKRADALKEGCETRCGTAEQNSARSERAPMALAAQAKATQRNRLVTSRVREHAEAMKESIVKLRAKLEAQVSSRMASEAKAKAQRHNELVALKKRAHAESVAHLPEDASTSAPATPPSSKSAPLLETPEKVNGPILLKSGMKLISVSAPCKYFGSAKGCRFGTKCMYKHTDPHFVAPCKHLMAGSCRFGGDCFFRHLDLEVPKAKPLQ